MANDKSGLITVAQAQEKRKAGIEQSSATSGDAWREYAIGFLREYLQQHSTMHVDSLWDAGLERPKSERALGAVILFAKKAGWIEYITTTHGIAAKQSKTSNMTLKAVWHSCIYGDASAQIALFDTQRRKA